MVGERTDAEIIAASLEDGAAFGEIFERHHLAIYRFLERRTDDSSAGDLAADVFAKAFSLRRRYDLEMPNSRPWLYGIARNLLRDHLRRRGRASAAYVRFSLDADTAFRSPEAEAEARIRVEQLRRAVKKLKKRDAEALIMFAVDGMDYAEIASTLGLKLGTVKSSINRARRKIGELIDAERPITGWGSKNRGDAQ